MFFFEGLERPKPEWGEQGRVSCPWPQAPWALQKATSHMQAAPTPPAGAQTPSKQAPGRDLSMYKVARRGSRGPNSQTAGVSKEHHDVQ